MSIPFAIAIYFLIWWIMLFAVLPFGLRTQEEAGDFVPGTPESAPARPRLMRVFLINTIVSFVAFGIVYAIIQSGWISLRELPTLPGQSLSR